MSLSVFDIFKIGLGPSSSHTVGPMVAAARFAHDLEQAGRLSETAGITTGLFGSLGATGKGHGSDIAVILGLCGHKPDQLDPDLVPGIIDGIRQTGRLPLLGKHDIAFQEKRHIQFHRSALPRHANGMRFMACNAAGDVFLEKEYYSIGGGFVMDGDGQSLVMEQAEPEPLPYPFRSAQELLEMADGAGLSIAGLMMENEKARRDPEEVRAGLLEIWRVMKACVDRGCSTQGSLPGGLNLRRRAGTQYALLRARPEAALSDPLTMLDWVNLYAMAVNEENAAGGRVVTAPTNGAAGVIPATLLYYRNFVPKADDDGIVDFLLTAGAIGILYKENASISGAEVGCQGEVGVACSMAAGALAAVMGGTNAQIENAAEIGMEHNLGMTCDPIGGLVQIPCIERNAMGAIKAINAARLAMRGDGMHYVSLDKVIKTMMRTGADMKTKYKETSRGGLAVNIIEC
ncbi:MAG: L-serine ammonia-lyase [Candidimonas sp.]|jgi:L-serine dehydratase